MPSNKQKWTYAHTREAIRRAYEIAATLGEINAEEIANGATFGAQSEQRYRANLVGAGLLQPRIEREVRRLRGLAEGRLVRSKVWRVRWYGGDGRGSITCDLSLTEARETRDRMQRDAGWRGVIVRVLLVGRQGRVLPVGRQGQGVAK